MKDEELWVEKGRDLLEGVYNLAGRLGGSSAQRAEGVCLGCRRKVWKTGEDLGATCCKKNQRNRSDEKSRSLGSGRCFVVVSVMLIKGAPRRG